MRRWGNVFLIVLMGVIGVTIGSLEGQGKEEKKMEKEGEKKVAEEVRRERIGRFAIDVPAAMHRAGQGFSLRYAEIEEVVWPEGKSREEARQEVWEANLAKIQKKTPPDGKEEVVIETKEFSDLGFWAKGILYYGDKVDDETVYWDVLKDAGLIGVWFRIHGLSKEMMIKNFTNIAKSYRYIAGGGVTGVLDGNWFYLQHGAINLPYLEQENAYVRFEGHPLGLTLEIKMNSTHETRPVPNLLERIEVAIRERFAPGLDVSRVRTQKRTVAGIPGEEVILRMTERGKTSFLFGWDYLGRKDSGEYPRIVIKMDAFDDKHLQEQTLLWDRMLDSMKPMYRAQ